MTKKILFNFTIVSIVLLLSMVFVSANNHENNKGIIEIIGDTIYKTLSKIIKISNAEHLDINRNPISDIYNEVKEKDNLWSETIYNNEYVRITFEEPLDNKKDITLYARGTGYVEVYTKDSDELIVTFDNINNEAWHKVYLTNLVGYEDTFDLKIKGEIEFDYIVDPVNEYNISFVPPTPANNTITLNTNVEINVSILNASDLGEVIFNWNGTNLSLYDNYLNLMLNFDNVSALGENDTHIVDVSNSGNNITVSGPTFNSTGRYGGAYDFTSANGFMQLTTDVFSTPNATWSVWIKISDVTTNKVIFGIGDSINNRLLVQVFNNNLTIHDDIDNEGQFSSFHAIDIFTWYNVVVVVNEDGTKKVYLDGSLIIEDNDGNNLAGIDPGSSLHIGSQFSGTLPFNGTLDEPRIWNRSLSANEINELYFSNLNKYEGDKWNLVVNQSKNSTSGLTHGTYTYFASVKDNIGTELLTDIREISINITEFDAPTWSNNKTNLNNETIKGNNVFFNITLNDLSPQNYIFSFFNGTTWENNSFGSYSDGEELSVTKTININVGDINWTWYFNDTFGNTNQSDVWSVTLINSTDGTFPTWSNNKTNINDETIQGASVFFNITLNESNPQSYIFSFFNGTEWENNSFGSYSDGEELNVIKTINIDVGDINWTWYFNDTTGNSNQSDEWGVLLIRDPFFSLINFTFPTPPNATVTLNTTIFINASINSSLLNEVKFNWNSTNFSIYDNNLNLMLNFDNVASLGEDSTTAIDVSSGGNDGGITSATFNSTGKYGGAYNFDGVNDMINVTTDNFRRPNITWGIWMKSLSGVANQVILSYGTSNSNRFLIQLTGVGLHYHDDIDNEGQTITGFANITRNKWHYINMVFNSSGGKKFYLDGQLVSTDNDGSSLAGINAGGVFAIGAQFSNALFFNGTLDEVRVWNKTLTSNEIEQQYFTNLNKYDTDKWNLVVNQSNTPTQVLSDGTYTYFASMKNSTNSEFLTDLREIRILTTDITFPTWSNNQTDLTNITPQSNNVFFSITLSDLNSQSYIFSFFNGTTWVNDTPTFYSNGETVSSIKNINIAEGDINWTWYFNDTFGNANKSDDFSVTLIDIGENITLTEIEDERIFQRNATTKNGTITLSGTYGGVPTSIEARIVENKTSNEIVPWTVIDNSPSNGTFSGDIFVPQGAWYESQVRFSNNNSIADNGTTEWGVGILVGAMGQSNMQKWFIEGEDLVANSLLKKYGTTNGALGSQSWQEMGSLGNGAKAFGNAIIEKQNIPVGLIHCAVGGSALTQQGEGSAGFWLTKAANLLYNNCTTIVNEAGNSLEFFVWVQGEQDASAGDVSRSTYAGGLREFITNFTRTDFENAATSDNLPFIITVIGRRIDIGVDTRWQEIRMGQVNLSNDADVYISSQATALELADNVHYSNASFILHGNWTANTVLFILGNSTYYRMPQITSANEIDTTTIDINIQHFGGSNFTPSSNITGFRVLSNGVNINISNGFQTDSDTIRLKLISPTSGNVSIDYLYGSDPFSGGINRSNAVYDNSTQQLPLLLAENITLIVLDLTNPIVTIDSPLNQTYNFNNIDLNVSANETISTWWFTNDSGITNNTFTPNTTLIWEQGTNVVFVYANDTQGNIGTNNVTFFIDSINPLIDYGVGTANDNANLEQTNIYINVSVTETNEANITFRLYNSSGEVNTTVFEDGTRFINFTNLPLTNYTYNVTVIDILNNQNTTPTRNINLTAPDTAAPIIIIDSPQNISYQILNISINVSANEEINTWWFTNDSGITNNTFTPNVTLTWDEGTNILFIYANDTFGNIGTNNVTFNINTTLPITPPCLSWGIEFQGKDTFNITCIGITTIMNDLFIFGNVTFFDKFITKNLIVNNSALFVNSLNDFVGIGTSNPTHKLNVVGDVNITNNLNVGGGINITGGYAISGGLTCRDSDEFGCAWASNDTCRVFFAPGELVSGQFCKP